MDAPLFQLPAGQLRFSAYPTGSYWALHAAVAPPGKVVGAGDGDLYEGLDEDGLCTVICSIVQAHYPQGDFT